MPGPLALLSRGQSGEGVPVPCFLQPPYLVPSRKAASTPVPGDLGVGLAGHHAFQIQGLPFGHVGGGGLDADGRRSARGWPTGRSQ